MAKKVKDSNGEFGDIFAVTNNLKIDTLPQTIWKGIKSVIPYGTDNLYPQRIQMAVDNSWTARGAHKTISEFLSGQGFEGANDIVVNRHGHKLGEILDAFTSQVAYFRGATLHFNFNMLGQVSDVQIVDFKMCRKRTNYETIFLSDWSQNALTLKELKNKVEIPIYKGQDSLRLVKEYGLGAVLYYSENISEIYPRAPFDASGTAAQLENKIGIYNIANIHNGFSASGIVKMPKGANFLDKDGNKTEQNSFEKVKGAENAGSVIVVSSPMNANGESDKSKMFEPFTIPSIDKMYENQIKNARESILSEIAMPTILIGRSESGMFNQDSYRDAFDYYNGRTEKARKKIEDSFNSWWSNSVFASQIKELKIIPSEIKQKQKQDDNGTVRQEANYNS